MSKKEVGRLKGVLTLQLPGGRPVQIGRISLPVTVSGENSMGDVYSLTISPEEVRNAVQQIFNGGGSDE